MRGQEPLRRGTATSVDAEGVREFQTGQRPGSRTERVRECNHARLYDCRHRATLSGLHLTVDPFPRVARWRAQPWA